MPLILGTKTHPYNCHHHEFLEISILLEGESEYIVQGQQYHATAGTVFLLIRERNMVSNKKQELTHINYTLAFQISI